MKNRFTAAIAPLLLSGCITAQPKVIVQRVEVPVPVLCVDRADIPPERYMETSHLQRADSVFVKVKATLIDLRGLEADTAIMRALLEGCAKPNPIERPEE